MLQFYFLSIVLNALAAIVLLSDDEGSVLEFRGNFSLKDETSKLVIGILLLITGLLKILSPLEGDIPVVGDLFPALSSFLSGAVLIFEFYRNRTSLDLSENSDKINRILISNKKIIGVVAIIAALLHFLFPKVLLL